MKEQMDAANTAKRELLRSKSESDVLINKLKTSLSEVASPDRQREAAVLKKERDDALLEVKQLQAHMQEARKQRDIFSRKAEDAAAEAKAAREAAAAKDGSSSARSGRSRSNEAAAPAEAKATNVSVEGLEGLYAEIGEAMRKLRKVPQKERASELRSLKRSYHPDAQKVKSPAVQQLFTQLSQHVNGFCDAHLRRDCQACQSAI